MNKTPIIIVIIIAILILCCCSVGALLWTAGAWQQSNAPYRYTGDGATTQQQRFAVIVTDQSQDRTADVK